MLVKEKLTLNKNVIVPLATNWNKFKMKQM